MSQTQAILFARAFQSQVARHPGAACLTLPILRELGVAAAVEALCPSEHTVSHGQVVTLLAANRLQAPRPIYRVGEWLQQTGLSTALGVQPEQAHDTRLGETLDAIYGQHQAIWQKIITQAVRRYHLSLQWLHYDITSTYFEGLYTESEWVQFGYSRDKRPDCKQLEIGLNVTGQGLPLAFRVLLGNTADRTTPRQNLEAVRHLLTAAQQRELTIIHDRGMADPDTLVWYGQQGQRFISPMTADSELQAVLDSVSEAELQAHPLAYHPARAKPDAPAEYYGVWREHTLRADHGTLAVRVLVVYSVGKARLDAQKREKAIQKLLDRLAEIQGHLNQRKYKRRDYTQEQIHLARRGNTARDLVEITLQGEDGNLTLTYGINAEKLAQAQQRDGRYPLVTNCWDLSADEVLQQFKEQDGVEKRIGVLKGPLRVHPLWLHKDERLISLVLMVMIALLVYCLLEHLVRQAQHYLTGRAILDLFANYTVVLVRFADGSQIWLYPEMSPPQTDLLSSLALPPPQATLML